MAKETQPLSLQAQAHIDSFKRMHPGATKEHFAAFIDGAEKQFAKDNPTMWPAVKAELQEALSAF